MFQFLFGWSKASKCKKMVKLARCRLKMLKIKQCSIIKHLREDMASLVTNGHEEIAFNRVEQLIQDQNKMDIFELLDKFCESILANLSYIRRHKDLPSDINEAVSSLIFASSRCGDLPELQLIRKLFGERYCSKFAMAAVELCPGNLVNDLIKEKLCIKSVSEDKKRSLVDEIKKDCIKTEVLPLEYNPQWHHKQAKKKEETDIGSSNDLKVSFRRTSPSESLPQFSMNTIVYLDDIVELQFTAAKEEKLHDQRVFKFKSNTSTKKYSFKQSFEKEDESWSDKTRSKNSRISGKRTRVRSASKERLNMKNSDCISYYTRSLKINAAKKQKSHYNLQHLKKSMEEEEDRKSSLEVRSNILSCKCRYSSDSHDRNDCSLEYPCYFCTNGYKDDHEIPPWKQKITTVTPRDDGFPIELKRSIKNRRTTGDSLQSLSLIIQNRESSSYPKAGLMTPERSKDAKEDSIPRSNSCPNKQPSYVHPKLPDYDDIAAKFKALKREHLQQTLPLPAKVVQNQSL